MPALLGRRKTTVQCSEEEILADGSALSPAFGDVAVDGGNHIERLGHGKTGGGTGKLINGDLGGLGA
jgi:hypothetical protein